MFSNGYIRIDYWWIGHTSAMKTQRQLQELEEEELYLLPEKLLKKIKKQTVKIKKVKIKKVDE